MRLPGSGVHYLQTSKLPFEFPGADGPAVLGVSSDITRLVQVENELRESEERYRAYVDRAPDSVFIADARGTYVDVNAAAVHLTGYSNEELLKMSLPDILHPDARCEALQDFAKLMSGVEISAEYHCLRADGSEYWMSMDAVKLSEERYMAFCKDISRSELAKRLLAGERDDMEQLVQERTRELETSRDELVQSQRLASVGTLAAGIAHEINNPIGAILNAAELAIMCREDEDAHDQQAQILDEIAQLAMRCGSIVRSVLRFSRGEVTSKSAADPRTTIDKAAFFVRNYALERSVTIEVEQSPQPATVVINSVEIEQVIVNVLRNAIDAAPRSGKVNVRCETLADRVRISVNDDGMGIDRESLAHIFDPFFTTRRAAGGTGLGLSVAHGIIAEHSGEIAVESELGKGTSFRIELPRSPTERTER